MNVMMRVLCDQQKAEIANLRSGLERTQNLLRVAHEEIKKLEEEFQEQREACENYRCHEAPAEIEKTNAHQTVRPPFDLKEYVHATEKIDATGQQMNVKISRRDLMSEVSRFKIGRGALLKNEQTRELIQVHGVETYYDVVHDSVSMKLWIVRGYGCTPAYDITPSDELMVIDPGE